MNKTETFRVSLIRTLAVPVMLHSEMFWVPHLRSIHQSSESQFIFPVVTVSAILSIRSKTLLTYSSLSKCFFILQGLVMSISTSPAFFCLKFSLQQIAIHIFTYQIKNRLQSTPFWGGNIFFWVFLHLTCPLALQFLKFGFDFIEYMYVM
jgi:hypothetical protein